MEEKILNLLKQIFKAKFGVSDDVYLGLAKALAATGIVTDENLETVVQGQESALKAYQTNFDRLNTEKSTLSKELEEAKLKLPTEEKGEETEGTGAVSKADIAAIVAESLKPFADKFSSMETQTATEKRNADISAKAKQYGIPESFVCDFNVPTDADLDTYFTDKQQKFANIGFEGGKSPEDGKGPDTNSNEIAGLINKGTKEIMDSKK